MFRIADDDGSHTLSQEELTEAIRNFGIEFSEDEVAEVFTAMDEDGTGSVNYDEFLNKLRVMRVTGYWGSWGHSVWSVGLWES